MLFAIASLEQEALVRRIASRIHRTCEVRSAARYQALVGAGTIALRAALGSYNPQREQSCPSYLKQRIHFAMFDALRKFNSAEDGPLAA